MWFIEGKIGEFCFSVVFITGVVTAMQLLRKCLWEILKKKNKNIENDFFGPGFYTVDCQRMLAF